MSASNSTSEQAASGSEQVAKSAWQESEFA